MSNENLSIGKRIKDVRMSLGDSMEEFGKRFSPEVTKGTISKWENGKYLPNNKRLKKIAELGNIDFQNLLYGDYTDYILTVLINELKSQNRLWDVVIEYLIISTDLGVFSNSVIFDNSGNMLSLEDSLRVIAETKEDEAIKYIKDNLDLIIKRIEDAADIRSIFGRDEIIINTAVAFVNEQLIQQSFSFEGYYRRLMNNLEEVFPTHFGKVDIQKMTEILEKTGLDSKSAKKKAIEHFYEDKIAEVQVDAMRKIKEIWKEYQKEKENM